MAVQQADKSGLTKTKRAWWMVLGSGITVCLSAILFWVITFAHHVSSANLSVTQGPQMPVTITFREAMLSRGEVARVSNYSDRPLDHLTVICSSASLNKSHQFEFPVLEARHSLSIGWHEGWDFSPGDAISVQAPGYATFSSTVDK